MEPLILERVYLPDRTLGSIFLNGETVAKTLELPWRDNKRSISCITEGLYTVIKQPPKESRPYPYFRLPNVVGRTGILIHRGTEPAHSKGCILVASRFRNVNTSKPTLEESGKKLQWLIDNLPDEFLLEIRAKNVAA
jgi:hypothetical protein